MAYCGMLDGLLEIGGQEVDLSRLDEGIIIAGDEEIDADEFIGDEEKLDFFNELALRTKADLLKNIDDLLKKIGEEGKSDSKRSPAFYTRYIGLVEEFRAAVEEKIFPEKLEDWWRYEYAVQETGVTLYLRHIGYLDVYRDDTINEDVDTEFELIHIKAKLLSVDQYAQVCGVTTTAVRQWIRRGKIRTALKLGSEWRIPELAEIGTRGYTYGNYVRKEYLTDLPEEYAFLNDYDYVYLEQNREQRDLYDVVFEQSYDWKKVPEEEWGNYQKKVQMVQKEREKFELYLIASPFVESSEATLTSRGVKDEL